MRRARMSWVPPAAMGTTKRTGRNGYACAQATLEKTGSALAPTVRRRNCRRGSFISIPPSLIYLFDHLVGAGEQHRRHLNAERLGGRQIDDEIEFGWLLDRDISGLRSAQNLVD